eukprot:8949482-Lingulodinium_polyedra.AAC.1
MEGTAGVKETAGVKRRLNMLDLVNADQAVTGSGRHDAEKQIGLQATGVHQQEEQLGLQHLLEGTGGASGSGQEAPQHTTWEILFEPSSAKHDCMLCTA